ncbi:hypothetical protein [Bacillus suaedaesalsae]|uniref:Uncharacterized protein n=1 Tax=Bacillus suaedaesalsae TaxID=2810349 RepID=A0ABS2DM32_9BACI|nr:hypothetical protein [Bacillus suaedaesalsae]MBM6619549.1 hypothetical protein [Bacillus suaedaesalsae]
MKKVLILPALLLMVSGCSDSKEAIKKVDTNEKMTVSQEVKKQNDVYINSSYDYSIKLENQLLNKIIIEDGDTTQIWYDDKTLVKDKVLIGKIVPMTKEEWLERKQDEYVMDIVNYDEAKQMVYVFQHNIEPYANYYTEDEHGEFLPPAESLEYDLLSQLFTKSLLQSNFIFGGIDVEQTIQATLDPAHLEMSEEWYHTLQVAFNDLELVLNKNDKELLAERLNSLISELNANSPVTNQFPYPSHELGSNLIEAYEQFHWLAEPPYYEDETNQLAIENQMTVIKQYLQTVDQQIKQIKNR